MADRAGIWTCHPDLLAEWNNFAEDCQQTIKSDLNSELWMKVWRHEVPSNSDGNNKIQNVKTEPYQSTLRNDDKMTLSTQASPSASAKEQENLQVGDVTMSDSLLKQLNSISHELADILEDDGEIPDDLLDEISSLPDHGLAFLLTELQSHLSDKGGFRLCSMLCEEKDRNPSVNVALVFQHFILPMLNGNGHDTIGAGMESGIIQLSDCFPSECVSHLLKPLLSSELSAPEKSELVARMLPCLPEKEFVSLIKYFILQCSLPMEEWQIKVLNLMLTDIRITFLETVAESPLIELLPALSSSARVLATSEPFASLLLKVIASLKLSISARVSNELAAIIQQNNTFNKQALMNALKSLGKYV